MFARYEMTTRRVRVWSTAPFTASPATDEADIELPPSTVLPGPANTVRLRADLSGFELDPALVPPPAPNGRGFERALMALFPTTQARNTLLIQYPLFLWSLRGDNYRDVKTLLDDARATGRISLAQYDQIVTAAQTNHIPGFTA